MSYSIIGEPVPRVDSVEIVTGAAKFTGDIVLPGMLHGAVLRSKHAHARILNIDTSRARKVPGVKAVITGKDVPQVSYGIDPNLPLDERILPLDKVRYAGEPVVAVAAVDRDTAQEALELIDVEYEVLPAVLNAEEALKPGAPLVHEEEWAKGNIYCYPVVLSVGDVEKGFAEADYIREDSFKTNHMNHAFLEPRTCIANFEPTGRLTMWASTQVPFGLRNELARIFGLPYNNVTVVHPFVGGAFGGKTGVDRLEGIAACLSYHSGRPVRMEYSRAEQFLAARHRHEITIKLKTGVKKDGTLTARYIELIYDGGAYVCQGFHIVLNTVGLADILWRTPNYYFKGMRIYTNKPPSAAMRSYDNVMFRFADDQHMDQIARDLGMDTVEFLLKNAREKGDVTNARYVLNSCGIKECIQKSSDMANWKEKRGKLPPGRGIGIGLADHTAGYKRSSTDASSAMVKVFDDGSVILFSGTEDHGQGARTIFAQMVAEVLGVPLEKVRVAPLDTDTCPPCMGCYGSRGTLQGGRATIFAAEDARRQIFEVVAQVLEAPVEDLVAKEGRIFVAGAPSKGMTYKEALAACKAAGKRVPIVGQGMFEPPTEAINLKDGTGNVSAAYGFGAQVAEVEVDLETGKVKVIKVTAANDAGKVLNLLSLNGQSEGSIHMGISHTLYEQVHLDKHGRTINPSFLNYKIATSLDTPAVESYWVETHDPEGPFGGKGIGETTLIATCGAIANAIYDATGVRIKELPITPEKILNALSKINNNDAASMLKS